MTALARIEDAIAAIGRGEIVVVVDDEDRENEGDLIMAAEFATPEKIAFFLQHTSGVICATLTSERAHELALTPMVQQNTESQRTAFLVTVDYRHGTSTGISAADRCGDDPGARRPGDQAVPTCCGPATSSRSRPATAASSSGPGTPRRPSTSPGWPAARRSACCARSSARASTTWRGARAGGVLRPTTACC